MMLRAIALNADSTTPRLAVDIVILATVAIQTYLGWQYGLVRRAFILLATFAAVVAASYAGNALAGLVRPNDVDGNTVGFIGVFLAITLTFEVVGALLSDHLRGMIVVLFDRCSGAAAGAILGVLQVTVVSLVIVTAGNVEGQGPATPTRSMGSVAAAIHSATVGSGIVALQPGVQNLFTPVLPANLQSHLAETAAPAAR